MPGRILNRESRTRIKFGLLAVAEDCMTYKGLQSLMHVARLALDSGEDLEAVRDACNARRVLILESNRRERKASELFTK